MEKTATLSGCGLYRFTLTRQWDERPKLLVVMFNPSTADATVDDPTISLLCHIASHNGYGGITVVNAIPLRSSTAQPAVVMANAWDQFPVGHGRWLDENLAVIRTHVALSGAVLLAWGALGEKCPGWLNTVQFEINQSLPKGVPVFCLKKTAAGHPMHPLARGKHKIPKNHQLIPWV